MQTGLLFGVSACLAIAVLGAYLQTPPPESTETNLVTPKLRILNCDRPDDFSRITAKAVAEHHKVFVLFTASLTSAGTPWCPDSRAAEPLLFAALEAEAAVSSVALVLCRLSRSEWGRGDRPSYLADVQVNRIPTLLSWTETGPVTRLVEEECKDTNRVGRLMRRSSGPLSKQLKNIITMSSSNQVPDLAVQSTITVFGTSSCPFCARARNALSDASLKFRDIHVNPQMRAALQKLTGQRTIPHVFVGSRFVGGCTDGPEPWMGVIPMLKSGELKEMAEQVSSRAAQLNVVERRDRVVVVGGGVAGLTASIYLARAARHPLVLAGDTLGQLQGSALVENFPGFPDGIAGSELMARIREQAERQGATVLKQSVVSIHRRASQFVVNTEYGDVVEATAVVIASGSVPRWLDLPGEAELRGKFLHTCVHCDATLYMNKTVLVVGGGDSAMEAAMQLAAVGAVVKLVHRRTEFRATAALSGRATAHTKISFEMSRVVVSWRTDSSGKQLEAAVLKSMLDGSQVIVPIDGAFMAIGHTPTSTFLDGIATDEKGYILLNRTMTSADGVFGCGDVVDTMGYHQAVTAAGSGAQAAIDANSWLMEHLNNDL